MNVRQTNRCHLFVEIDNHNNILSPPTNQCLLCKKLSEAFKEHNYELTAAVSASQSVIANAYEIPEISKYLDAIHMMSYDMHGSWEKLVNHHSPLYGADWDPLTTDFG